MENRPSNVTDLGRSSEKNGTWISNNNSSLERLQLGIGTCVRIAIILTNLPVLIAFYRIRRRNLPAFSLYLVNLSIVNLFQAVIEHPFQFILQYRLLKPSNPSWFCVAYMYLSCITCALMLTSHLAITLNRVWAVTFPQWYRRYHNGRVAFLGIAAIWTYLHAVILPGLLLDAILYRTPADNVRCLFNMQNSGQRLWMKVFYGSGTNVCPIFAILGAYPWVWWKTSRRKMKTLVRDRPEQQPGAQSSGSTSGADATKRTQKTAFRVLTLLTLSTAVCWSPICAYFTALMMLHIPLPTLYTVAQILWSVQPMLDPIMFAFVMADLRAEVKLLIMELRQAVRICCTR